MSETTPRPTYALKIPFGCTERMLRACATKTWRTRSGGGCTPAANISRRSSSSPLSQAVNPHGVVVQHLALVCLGLVSEPAPVVAEQLV
jgi:hypothetical protein